MDWQTAAALGIVAATAALFALRFAKRRRAAKTSERRHPCGAGCACPHPRKPGKA